MSAVILHQTSRTNILCSTYSNVLPVPADVYVGKSLTELETEAHQKAVEKAREEKQKKKAVKAKRISHTAKSSTVSATEETSKEADVTIIKVEGEAEPSKDADVVTVIKVEEPTAAEDTASEGTVETVLVPVAVPTGLLTPAQGDGSDPFVNPKNVSVDLYNTGEKDVAVVEIKEPKAEEVVAIKETTDPKEDKSKDDTKDAAADVQPPADVVKKDTTADSTETPAASQDTAGLKVEDEDPKPVHDGITCDGCGVSPIVGNRYRCLESVSHLRARGSPG